METKVIDVYDRATRMVLGFVAVRGTTVKEKTLLSYAGYHPTMQPEIIMISLSNRKVFSNLSEARAYGRTTYEAYLYVMNNWDSLKTGDAIDVEYILGEKPAPRNGARTL